MSSSAQADATMLLHNFTLPARIPESMHGFPQFASTSAADFAWHWS